MTKLILSESVIIWYEKNSRKLPWRPSKGKKPNPFHVLLSEFMLQQTVVKTVIPYFNKFILKYPNIQKLAQASLEDVMLEWSGLGYYRRARNLHETSKIIFNRFAGKIPQDYKTLISMPGIGEYTASAILAISFDQNTNVIDGNIERVMCRINRIKKRVDLAKKEIKLISSKYIPDKNNSLYVQGLMDIGATICTPKKTFCSKCPVNIHCKVAFKKISVLLPIKRDRLAKPIRKGTFFCYIKERKKVLFFKNKDTGLFSNMNVLPSKGFEGKSFSLKQLNLKVISKKRVVPIIVHHKFTHFDLEGKIVIYELKDIDISKPYELIDFSDLEKKPVPNLFKKIINCIKDELNINV